jgi:hypothetical protein
MLEVHVDIEPQMHRFCDPLDSRLNEDGNSLTDQLPGSRIGVEIKVSAS